MVDSKLLKNFYSEFEKKNEFESFLIKNKDEARNYALLEYIIELENAKIDWDAIAKKCDEESNKYDAPRLFNKEVLKADYKESNYKKFFEFLEKNKELIGKKFKEASEPGNYSNESLEDLAYDPRRPGPAPLSKKPMSY